MIKEKKMISKLIFDNRHAGTVNVLWFEDLKAEKNFIDFLEYAGELPATVQKDPAQSSRPLASLFAYTSDQYLDTEQVRGEAMEHIDGGAEVLVLKNPGSDEAFYEMVLSLKHYKRPSIFLVDEKVSSSFISDKIICVDRAGEITDVFSPFMAEC